jgi:FKBP-type peptidyl-prolyl cis-trans isomerase 2
LDSRDDLEDEFYQGTLKPARGAPGAPPTRETIVPFSSRALLGIALFLSALVPAHTNAQEEEKATVVTDGQRVSIEYTLKLADGAVADSNVGGEALTYVQGESQILPALEKELIGMKVGESKRVSLTAADGYGGVDASLFQTAPTSAIPEEARKVGTTLLAQSSTGQQRPVRVHEVRDEEIVLDLNHPLAGQALNFDVKILAIE